MADLYFKNISTDGSWNNVLNWFTDIECTTQSSNVPWVELDETYLNYDLHRGNDSFIARDVITIDAEIGEEVIITGNCTIGDATENKVNNSSLIYGGTFSGDNFQNNGNIYGGTFSGANYSNNNHIYGGTFSGINFSNNCYIYGGTFSGINFSNNCYIYGGIFSGINFSNNNYGNIIGGAFSSDSFTNNSASYIYGGVFSGNGFYPTGEINAGMWLKNGTITVYDSSGDYRFSGKGGVNPYDIVINTRGFMTIDIPGQDIIGSGLL